MKIKIKNIEISSDRREINPNKVRELADSIKQIGLINPITVRMENGLDKLSLIAGMHRLEACKLLGIDEIEANIKVKSLSDILSELIEIDENLIRNELHYTERADALVRRKEIYEELYPETKKGAVNQYTKVLKSESDDSKIKQNLPKDGIRRTDKPSFVEDTSEKTGKSETVIKEELQIGRNLEIEEKEVIKKQDINKTEAIKLARMDSEERKPVVELFSKGEVKKVDEAKQILDPIDMEYDSIAKEIEAKGKRIKKVQNLLNYTQHLGITEQHLREYFEMFPSNLVNFPYDLEKLKALIDEVIITYGEINQIRMVR